MITGSILQAQESVIADRVVRYVNDEVITQNEVWQEVRSRFLIMQRAGAEIPSEERAHRAFIENLRQETLERLTDEMLLVQEARRLGVQLDLVFIRRQVRDFIRDNNLSPTVAQEAREQRRRIRENQIHAVQRFYESRSPAITPSDIHRFYTENPDIFAMPQQVWGHRLLLRPSSPEDHRRYQRDLMALLQRVQTDPLPAVAGAIEDEQLSQIARAEEGERTQLLTQALRSVLERIPAEAPARTRQLAEQLQDTLARGTRMRDSASVRHLLSAIAEEVNALEDAEMRLQRFIERTREHSQGPRAEQGGDLEWQEIGSQDATMEEFLFATPVGQSSQPFTLGEFLCLVFVRDRVDDTLLGLRESTPQIRSHLRREREQAVRQRLVSQLRRRALIRDMDIDMRLPPEWFIHEGS